MNLVRIRLQWAAARQTPGKWHLGLWSRYARRDGGSGLIVSVRGALYAALLLAVLGYFGTAYYFYFKLERREINYVTYTDLLLYPLRHQEIDQKRGLALIAEGLSELPAGSRGAAFPCSAPASLATLKITSPASASRSSFSNGASNPAPSISSPMA
jgi:hypothetical protein